MELGAKIKHLRLSQHLTLQQLSEKIDISVSFLSDIEHNRSKPSLERLKEIAKGLNTCVSELLEENTNVCQEIALYLAKNIESLKNDELYCKIFVEFTNVSRWPVSEKLKLFSYLQSKNKHTK